ncbi:MAG: glycosyltransferase, partial [Dictyoglomus thermophilum]
VECISRATPLLINKIPPVVEYLGEEYPFYYSSYEEAIEKANDYDLVLKTHEYLKTYSIRDKLTPQYFKESILKSFIVKQIEKDLEINSLGDKRKLIFRKSTKFDDTIYIVTPCYNAVETIDQTILSVVSQAGPFSIRYHVQDGGSTDGTLEKLEEWKWKIENQIVPTFCKKVDFTFDSAPDNGMYDAIVKGFQYIDNIPSKAMMTWINADDLVLHGCFATAYLISKNFDAEEIPWITGIPYVKRNFYPQPFNLRAIYPQEIVASGCADGIHWFDIQQEGTFFRKWLWDEVNAVEELPKFRHAGDWNLWRLFAKVTSPVLVPWVLAMFRYNPDKPTQLSIKFKNQRESEIEATVPLEDRRNSLRTLVEEGTLSYLRITMPWPGDKIFLVKKKPILMAPYHYYQVFNEWPQNSIYKEKWREEEEEIILERETKYIQSFTPLKSKTITEEPAKFYIVTPSLNSASTIDETILSVVSQEGDFYIYYHIQDGGSVDLTLERLLYWEAVLSNPNPYVKCRGVYFSWASEPDSSMYEAILKGFSKFIIRPDDFITWINADDVLLPGALATVCAIKRDNPHIHWIGSPQYVFEKKPYEPVFFRRTPTPTDVIRQGLCDGKSWPMLQQEGTFFKYHLFFKSKHVLRHFKFAGDFALWMEMAKYAEYYQSEKPLGAFRRRKGQLSVEHHAEYMKEVEMAKRML